MNKQGLKLHKVIGGFLALAAALPGAASANPLPDMAAGEIDAIVTFCSRLDPRLESDAERLRTVLLRETERGARSSAEYRQGYDLVSDALVQVERKQALAACGTLSGKPEHAR
ncbi:MAG TPA: hypothetical protein VEU54_07250 [Steroidobacteraceae bacterium]|nr:hypothetical protein [Steroidobacteraceae bacterium]